ncbi:MAG: hypothetical protein ABUL46_00320 [Chitinophaga rupis]
MRLLILLAFQLAICTIKAQNYSAYLFVYFTGNEKTKEAIHFALIDPVSTPTSWKWLHPDV